MTQKTRLKKLEAKQPRTDRPTWAELMQADGKEWQQIRRDFPDLAAWWDGGFREDILAKMEAAARGDLPEPTQPLSPERQEILDRLQRIAENC